jgi:hypothetical protein
MTKLNNGFTYKDGVSLRDYFDSRLDALEKATTLAKDNMELRLEVANEWRAQSKDREMERIKEMEKFATKDSLNTLEAKVDTLRLNEKALAGKADQTTVDKANERADRATRRADISLLVGVVGIIISTLIKVL